jgi:hypothetical protein
MAEILRAMEEIREKNKKVPEGIDIDKWDTMNRKERRAFMKKK